LNLWNLLFQGPGDAQSTGKVPHITDKDLLFEPCELSGARRASSIAEFRAALDQRCSSMTVSMPHGPIDVRRWRKTCLFRRIDTHRSGKTDPLWVIDHILWCQARCALNISQSQSFGVICWHGANLCPQSLASFVRH